MSQFFVTFFSWNKTKVVFFHKEYKSTNVCVLQPVCSADLKCSVHMSVTVVCPFVRMAAASKALSNGCRSSCPLKLSFMEERYFKQCLFLLLHKWTKSEKSKTQNNNKSMPCFHGASQCSLHAKKPFESNQEPVHFNAPPAHYCYESQ